MAVFAFTNPKLTVNAVDLSDHVRKATLDIKADELDSTAASSSGYRSRIGGLKDYSLTLEFNSDFAASSVDATLFAALGTVVAFTLKSVNTANSSTNPEYQGNVLISDVNPIDNSIGDLATVSVTWPGSGTLTRAIV